MSGTSKLNEPDLNVPFLKLSSGFEMPQIGFGTWLIKDLSICKSTIIDALRAGYRHLDCAFVYGNQSAVGAALEEAFSTSILKRDDLFLTSKVWNTFHSHDRTIANVEMILRELSVAYVDLMLIHWPIGYSEESLSELFPKNCHGKIVVDSDIDYMETWSALEECVLAGKIRSIGLSNFNATQVQRVIDEGKIRPVVLQVEMNPFFQQQQLAKFCREQNVVLTAYSPLLNTNSPFHRADNPSVFTDPLITEIAKRHGMTNAQVALRFLAECHGAAVITKSVSKERIRENLAAFTATPTDISNGGGVFSAEEMERLRGLDRGEEMRRVRPMGLDPTTTKYFPF